MIGDTNHGTLTFRGATFAAVTLENPVLAAFEPHVAVNGSSFVFKIGDGIRAYNDLPNLAGATATAADVGIAHRSRVEDYLRARGGSIGTNGLPAVALRFDHGLANFKTTILPMLTARQLPASLALNTSPDNMALAENAGVLWADVRDMTMEKGIEPWNHSHTHGESVTEAEIRENAVTAPFAVFETELPNSTVEGFVVPGGLAEWNGWTDTNTVDHFGSAYVAGSIVMARHALVTGHLGGAVWSLTGQPVNGRRHLSADAMTSAQVIAAITRAQLVKGGVVIMMHPSLLNTTGMSTATLTAILDHIVAERDAGRLMVLTMSGLMGADVRSSYRHNVLAPFSANTPWTPQTNYTLTGDVFSSSTATAEIRQTIQFTDIEALKGRLREFSVEARALTGTGTATLRLNVVSSGTNGSISHLQNFVLPADSVWRRYRLFPQILRTAFSGNYDAGRVAGTGTLEMRDARLEAV